LAAGMSRFAHPGPLRARRDVFLADSLLGENAKANRPFTNGKGVHERGPRAPRPTREMPVHVGRLTVPTKSGRRRIPFNEVNYKGSSTSPDTVTCAASTTPGSTRSAGPKRSMSPCTAVAIASGSFAPFLPLRYSISSRGLSSCGPVTFHFGATSRQNSRTRRSRCRSHRSGSSALPFSIRSVDRRSCASHNRNRNRQSSHGSRKAWHQRRKGPRCRRRNRPRSLCRLPGRSKTLVIRPRLTPRCGWTGRSQAALSYLASFYGR
jgi:hypothetical protein